jgi:hypothetical protein
MYKNVIINDEILNKISMVSYDKMVCVASVSEITKKREDDDILKILEEEGF